jgi:hypothetical protein
VGQDQLIKDALNSDAAAVAEVRRWTPPHILMFIKVLYEYFKIAFCRMRPKRSSGVELASFSGMRACAKQSRPD